MNTEEGSKGRSKQEIISSLEGLSQEPGFLYSLAMVLRHDFFLDPSEAVDINWRERLSFQEAVFIAGLMIKHPLDASVLPTEKESGGQVERLYELFQELHEAHFVSFWEKSLQREEAPKTPEEFERSRKEIFGSGEFMVEPIFYGGSGAYDFQYWEIAPKKYAKDNEWLVAHKGVSIQQMADISKRLKELHELKANDHSRKIETFVEACHFCLETFCFSKEDLIGCEGVDKFLEAFSVRPGEVNHGFDTIGAYNILDSHPIIELGEGAYFLPSSFGLTQSIYESPFYWMRQDKEYFDAAVHHRGDATEELAYEMLVQVFGRENVYKNIQIDKAKGEHLTDIDVLAVAGNKAVIIQAKSKKLTEVSRKGDGAQLKADFKDAVQSAYEQALISRASIIDKNNKLTDVSGKTIKLDERIDDAYIICLSSDHYPAVTHQTEVYLEKQLSDPFPLSMSVFDLDIVAFYLNDPFEFLYYLRQRTNLSGYYKASSEIVLLACHLRQKLFPREGIQGEGLDDSFAQLIDANYPVMRGYVPKTNAAEKLHNQWKNEKFNQLVAKVKATGEPGFTDALFFLYDLAGDGANDLIEYIDKARTKALQDRQIHDFTMIFDKGKSGVTFICAPDVKALDRRLLPHAAARKYKARADMWLGMGSVLGSPNVIDAIAFNKQPWEHDDELENASKIVLKEGQPINKQGKKLGRNERCYCDSGLKYKKCCGK